MQHLYHTAHVGKKGEIMFIIEVKEKKEVQVGERYEKAPFSGYTSDNRYPIMEEQTTLLLRQEVERLDLKALVKLINKID